ncbi:hypothetical protein F7725_001674 [Dissostichus mawsoni]|uniref:Uncharacterized protein n=1 Tax=Dissostichus mawsoni TaxID=36200 RepID=A0A7J5Y095_DISMA|nr:hypothetical protein F7725_001674 [Dissostichus mawsoni]
MADIASLLEDHRKALSADFKSTISTLEAKLDRIQATVLSIVPKEGGKKRFSSVAEAKGYIASIRPDAD